MSDIKGKISDVRQLLSQCSMNVSIYIQICDILEDVERRMYALNEDNKRIIASNRSLDTRYGEMMQLLRDIRHTQLER